MRNAECGMQNESEITNPKSTLMILEIGKIVLMLPVPIGDYRLSSKSAIRNPQSAIES